MRFLQCCCLSVLFTEMWRLARAKGFPYLLAWCLEKNWGAWGKSGESGDLLRFITALGHMSPIEPEKFSSCDHSLPQRRPPSSLVWWEPRKIGFWTSAVFILLLPFLVFNSLKITGSGRSCQGKITTTACYFLPPQIFLCLCLLFFLWLTCFSSCLLNIPGYERTMRESWPRILQTLKFNSWFYPSGFSPRTIKLIKNFLFLSQLQW